jgi:hypothetical protein
MTLTNVIGQHAAIRLYPSERGDQVGIVDKVGRSGPVRPADRRRDEASEVVKRWLRRNRAADTLQMALHVTDQDVLDHLL